MSLQETGFIGAGTVYVKRLDDPAKGFFEIGNTPNFVITISSEKKERISKKKNSYGSVLDTVVIPKAPDLKMTLDTFNPDNLAMAFMGNLEHKKMTSEHVDDEHVPAQVDRWLPVEKKPLKKGSVSVKLKDDTSVEAEKIEVNHEMGFIRLAEDVPINSDEYVKVTYDTIDGEAWITQAGAKAQLRCAIIFDGKNQVTGENVRIDMPRVTLASNGDFDIYSDDFNSIDFSGQPELIEGSDSAFTITTWK